MKCPKCGKEIPNDSIYCEFCGVQVEFSDALHKKSKRILWIILSVVLAVVIAVVAFAIIQEQQERQAVIAWEQQQATQKQQELEQQLEAEHQAKLEAERKAELARQEAVRKAEAERKAELARQEAARKAEAERQAELLKYVDLGLPSGTCWRNSNEGGDNARYTYNEAVSRFGNKLPTKQQLEELENKCTWTWTGSGCKVTGPNGNSIYLPAAGYRGCYSGVDDIGTGGYYWSSTPYDSDDAWYLNFDSSGVYMISYGRCFRCSVRLVQ